MTDKGTRLLMQTMGLIKERAALASRMGRQFSGDRDVYEALGYEKNLTYEDFEVKYRRQDIARRIIEAYPNATWRAQPDVVEIERQPKGLTDFEAAWRKLCRKISLWHYLLRADRISGIGQYGVLFLGFRDGGRVELPVPANGGRELLFMQPYTQNNAEIATWIENPNDPRYGQPATYRLKISKNPESHFTKIVHWTRIVHIAEGLTENEVYGAPRLECVYNKLDDLAKVSGCSGEMFWRNTLQTIAFIADKDADFGPTESAELNDEIEAVMHKLRNYLKLQGMTVQQLSVQVADPKPASEVLVDLIAGATGIPKRILMGSERGELSSDQDEKNWLSRVDERRTDFAEPRVLRPIVDRLIWAGVLPAPKDNEYLVDWPDINALTEKEQADIGEVRSRALRNYMSNPEAQLIMPRDKFLLWVMGLDREQVEEIEEQLGDQTFEDRVPPEQDIPFDDNGDDTLQA